MGDPETVGGFFFFLKIRTYTDISDLAQNFKCDPIGIFIVLKPLRVHSNSYMLRLHY